MMRITRLATPDGGETLRVEGRVTHETAAELRTACDDARGSDGSLRLDVSAVQYVDATGVDLLLTLERDGTALEGRSGFVGALLTEHGRTMPDDDAGLLARLRRGDPQAFETLVRRYGGRLLATARRFVGNDELARDVVQDAYLAAFRALDGFNGAARLSTWLHRIVVNAALMKLRSRRRRPEDSIEDLLPRFDDTGHWAEPPSAGNAPVDVAFDREESRRMVRRAIEALPETHRAVLLLRDIEELDTDETAAMLDITPNAVRTRLHRARQALRTLLERELPGVHDRTPLSA